MFGIKRTHLRIVETLKRVIQDSGLTPARFDMLRIIGLRTSVRQRIVQFLLGVSAATVSRMLKALVKGGSVVKIVSPRDARERELLLTELGRAQLSRAYALGIDTRVGEHMMAAAVERRIDPPLDSTRIRKKVWALEDLLVGARRIFDDDSVVRHPWFTGDIAIRELTPFTRDAAPAERPASHIIDPSLGKLPSRALHRLWKKRPRLEVLLALMSWALPPPQLLVS